ncbi:hypothetical protein K2Y11_01060 [bacterium]|jgi:hypothetical protein|nr:hypothetical protein [bacterium]
MISDVLSYLDYSVCAEIALVLFVTVFLGVTLRVALMRRDESEYCARIPIEDGTRRNSDV